MERIIENLKATVESTGQIVTGRLIFTQVIVQTQTVQPFANEEKKMIATVNILGTEYKVIREQFKDKDSDGYCDYTSREIKIRDDNVNEVGDFDELMRKKLRHEIIHTFLAESGLQANFEHYRQFGHDETLVDWFAIQFPKMIKAFASVNAL